MNKKEVINLITLLSCNYKAFDINDKTKLQVIVETYYSCLSDLDYKLCMSAVKKIMMENPYPPTVYSIRKACIDIMNPNITKDDCMETWHEIFNMICNGLYMTQEEYDRHSIIAKKFIGGLRELRELAITESSIVNSVIKGQFLKQFEILKQREIEKSLLPQNFIKELSDKFSIEKKEGN